MIDWYKKVVFENYANFNGRARRAEYWYYTLATIIINVILMILDELFDLKIGSTNQGVLSSIYGLAVFVPGIAVSTRRLHDIGKSGWLLVGFYAIVIIAATVVVINALPVLVGGEPALGLTSMIVSLLVMIAVSIYILVLFCTEGERGENQYGSDPKALEEV